MKSDLTLKDLVKYVIFIGVVYALIKIIPSQEISIKDIVLIVVVISLSFIFVDCLTKNLESFTNNNDPDVKKLFDIDLDVDLHSLKINNTSNKNNNQSNRNDTQNNINPISKDTTNDNDPILDILKSNNEKNGLKYSKDINVSNNKINLSNCDADIEKLKKQMTTQMIELQVKIKELQSNPNDEHAIKYINFLMTDLADREVLDSTDIENIRNKLNSKLISNNDAIAGLEKLNLSTKSKVKIKELQSNSNNEHAIKYINFLLADLTERDVLDSTDIENIRTKINSKLISNDEAITGLEKLKLSTKSKQKKSDNVSGEYNYGNLPPDFYKPLGNSSLSKWEDGYTILNTDKWQVPMPRPPVCINTTPCKVCPSMDNTYPVQLGEWDNSRKISNIEISKDWANKQVDPKT